MSVVLLGGDGNDRLRGENHNDFLDGGYGADTLEGGSGNDHYLVYTNNDGVFEDRVIENAYSGYDTLETNADAIALPANVEKLVLKWTSWDGAIGVGNDLNNSIHGGFYNDTLVGLDGMDNIYGGLGGDKIDGGDGLDFLYGEEGSDELIGGESPDFLNGYSEGVNTNEFDTLTGGAGGDRFYLNYNNTSIAYMGNGYATITDFNPSESDKVVLVGEQGLYTTQGSDFDINIYRGTDLIGVVEDGLRVGFSMTDDVIYM